MRPDTKRRPIVAWLIVAAVLMTSAGTAAAHDGTDHTEPGQAPPTTVAGTDTADDDAADAAETATPTTAAPAAATAKTTTTSPRGKASKRDPRWRRYRCKRGINACKMAKYHQDHGHFQGQPGHKWSDYRRQARAMRKYVKMAAKARTRRALVQRWSGVARCETGGNWKAATGNGYYGGLQFGLSTWRAYGGTGYPHRQPAWKQAQVADRARVRSGLGHWPHCGRHYG